MNYKTDTPYRVQVLVDCVGNNGWARATITRSTRDKNGPCCGDHVAIPKSIRVKRGDHVICKIVLNRRNHASQKWFAVFCERNAKLPGVSWDPWQDGQDALVLKLPSTRPGSLHDGIALACWKCGQKVVESSQIFRISKTCVWTNLIQDHPHLCIDTNQDYNDVKDCFVQKVRCRCKNMLGSYYEEPYEDSDETQGFPCFKFVTAWEKKKWKENRPSFAMVLLGDKTKAQESIDRLEVSEEWEIEKDFLVGGRVDKTTYMLMEKAKEAKKAQEEAESRAKEAKQVAEETAAEMLRRAQNAESLAATKAAEAEAAAKHAKDLEQHLLEGKSTTIKQIIWECNVEGDWFRYPSDICDSLETGFSKGGSATTTFFRLQNRPYEVVFLAMEQRNIETGYRREVRRREVAHSTVPQQVSWECKLDKQWIQYPFNVASTLEAHHQQKSNASFRISNKQYEIDFHLDTLEQVNIETGFKRDVRRRETTNTAVTVSTPETWTQNPPDQNCVLVPLSEGSLEWKKVKGELNRTLPGAKLQRVLRVQNRLLWEYFCFRKERATKLSGGGDPNVVSVWHGTRKRDPKTICKDGADGFMMQHSRSGMWGQGIYFAARASYSHGYATQETRHDRGLFSSTTTIFRTLILAKLVAGEEVALERDSSLRLCPEKPDGNGRFDTVTGTTEGSKVYIVYENGRAYPEYLVTYTTS